MISVDKIKCFLLVCASFLVVSCENKPSESDTKTSDLPELPKSDSNQIPNSSVSSSAIALPSSSPLQSPLPGSHWMQLPSDQFPAFSNYVTATQSSDKIYVWGSNIGPAPQYFKSPVGATFDLSQMKWSPMAIFNAPLGGETAFWNGSKLILWMGVNGQCSNPDVFRNSGGVYDPSVDAWSNLYPPLGAGNGAYPPQFLTCGPGTRIVWTGSKIVSVPYGYVVDVATNTYSTLTTNNFFGDAVFWTGSKVIHWGGIASQGGFLYDIENNTAQTISTINAPSPRSNTNTAWLGNKLFVWGGQKQFNTTGEPLADGAIYDPATDQWTTISATGAPPALSNPTLIWTGSKLILWGGSSPLNGNHYVTNGYIFDPTSNSWAEMPTENAPSRRFGHSATWTGSELVIWGGQDGGSLELLSTGAIFNIDKNKWTPMDDKGAPAARYRHQAFWIGGHFVVLSGIGKSNQATYLNDGAIYTP